MDGTCALKERSPYEKMIHKRAFSAVQKHINWNKENVFKKLVIEKIIMEFIVSYNSYKLVNYDYDYAINVR